MGLTRIDGELTDLEQRFVEAYLRTRNATLASIEAGFTNETRGGHCTNGSMVIRRPNVAQAIKTRIAESVMSADEVLERLSQKARAPHTAYIKPTGKVDLKGLLNAGLGHLIESVTPGPYGPKVEFARSLDALKLIGQYHQLFTERVKVDTEVRLIVQYGQYEPEPSAITAEYAQLEDRSSDEEFLDA